MTCETFCPWTLCDGEKVELLAVSDEIDRPETKEASIIRVIFDAVKMYVQSITLCPSFEMAMHFLPMNV